MDVRQIVSIAVEAGEYIKTVYYDTTEIEVTLKEDESPVTIADVGASHLIIDRLSTLYPDIPVISEEACEFSFEKRQHFSHYWLIDPLDGTKEFIHKTDDFTVNIALMEHNEPILGIVYAPISQIAYFAKAKGQAFKLSLQSDPHPIHVKKAVLPYRLMISRRHGQVNLQPYLGDKEGQYQLLARGSAIKACLIAEGQGDLYPRLGPTSEWDTAAAHCILRCAGGDFLSLEGKPLTYNDKQNFINPDFVAIGDVSQDWLSWLGIKNKF